VLKSQSANPKGQVKVNVSLHTASSPLLLQQQQLLAQWL
jgi:hypothetical protein